jgi:peptidoglycan/LPS O-acetylase OafA/YrhL
LDFFKRRVRRIYPPLWTAIALSIVACIAFSQVGMIGEHCQQLPRLEEFTVWNWVGNLTASETWLHNVVGGHDEFVLHNTWTLCFEEQFYLVGGLLLFVAPRRLFLGAGLVTAFVLAGRHGLRFLGLTSYGFFWDGHWLVFAIGILLYQTVNYLSGSRKRLALAAMAMGLLYAAVDRTLTTNPYERHLSEYIFVGCLFGLALVWLKPYDQKVSDHWLVLPLRWCGERSYSIYLSHYLIVVVSASVLAQWGVNTDLRVALITVPCSLLLAIPSAILFYHTVERRFTNGAVRELDPKQRGRKFLAGREKGISAT